MTNAKSFFFLKKHTTIWKKQLAIGWNKTQTLTESEAQQLQSGDVWNQTEGARNLQLSQAARLSFCNCFTHIKFMRNK